MTCRPWKPVVRKNTDPYPLREIVFPSPTWMRYSLAWPSTKIRPMKNVRVNQRRSLKTSPFSAANTPIWQVTLDATRMIVNGSA